MPLAARNSPNHKAKHRYGIDPRQGKEWDWSPGPVATTALMNKRYSELSSCRKTWTPHGTSTKFVTPPTLKPGCSKALLAPRNAREQETRNNLVPAGSGVENGIGEALDRACVRRTGRRSEIGWREVAGATSSRGTASSSGQAGHHCWPTPIPTKTATRGKQIHHTLRRFQYEVSIGHDVDTRRQATQVNTV